MIRGKELCAVDWWGDEQALAYEVDDLNGNSLLVTKSDGRFRVEAVKHSYDSINEAIVVAFEYLACLRRRDQEKEPDKLSICG